MFSILMLFYRDAAWETEPNAFTDLLERYLHCDAQRCNCDKGRDYNKDGGSVLSSV